MMEGDLWLLGEHRLLCGDATNPLHIAKLIDNNKISLGLHDPPYGLTSHVKCSFGDGKKGGLAKRGKFDPVYGDDKPFDPGHLINSGTVVVIWGGNHFASRLPSSSAWIVWDKRDGLPSNDMSDGELAWVSTGNTTRIIRHKWNGFDRASERGIKRIHPTQKPIWVMSQIIEKYTQPEDIITDWYAGSGTTLISAEQTNRKAFVIEIMPGYCEKIISRWEELTSRKAIQIKD